VIKLPANNEYERETIIATHGHGDKAFDEENNER